MSSTLCYPKKNPPKQVVKLLICTVCWSGGLWLRARLTQRRNSPHSFLCIELSFSFTTLSTHLDEILFCLLFVSVVFTPGFHVFESQINKLMVDKKSYWRNFKYNSNKREEKKWKGKERKLNNQKKKKGLSKPNFEVKSGSIDPILTRKFICLTLEKQVLIDSISRVYHPPGSVCETFPSTEVCVFHVPRQMSTTKITPIL